MYVCWIPSQPARVPSIPTQSGCVGPSINALLAEINYLAGHIHHLETYADSMMIKFEIYMFDVPKGDYIPVVKNATFCRVSNHHQGSRETNGRCRCDILQPWATSDS
jgi:hypothetical protein